MNKKQGENKEIHSFNIEVSEKALEDLRRRIMDTRWPDKETVNDDSQGVPLAMMKKMADYWAKEYDWRKIEKKLNALPQFMTEIDGLNIHFIHVKSQHENALPLIVTHGWPGSIIEQLKIIKPLTDPIAYGGKAEDAFHVVIPSIPGYGFSDKPTTVGWDHARVASVWVELMKRLGYNRFVAQGGDVGSLVSYLMAKQAPPELAGIHSSLPFVVSPEILAAARNPVGSPPAGLSGDEMHAYEQLHRFETKHLAYALMMSTRPQTVGYSLTDSPIGLAAWLTDHGDGSGQPGFIGKVLEGNTSSALTRDDVLDNITLYWLTNTATSAARMYWEGKVPLLQALDVPIPIAISAFPDELYQAPKSWTEKAHKSLIYYNKPKKGGHFAAWEEPEIFAEELRAAFKTLR